MGEYILYKGDERASGIGLTAETNKEAISKMEEHVMAHLSESKEWSLFLIERDRPEIHDAEDDIGTYYASFVHHMMIDGLGKVITFDDTMWDDTVSIALDDD